ncbi:MAG: DinB family protein [Bacteroidetes bacterium]|nr:DinB family protein [Bacteroidota bacterium]
MKKTLHVFYLILFILITNYSQAQNKQQMVQDWERAKAYTKEYLDAMPENGYGFRPSPEMKSFAEQMLHFTDANYELASLAAGVKNPLPDGAAFKSADQSKAATTQMVLAGYDYVIHILQTMTPEQLQDSITLFGKYEMTKQTLFYKLFEHQTHHRGQTTVYLHLMHATVPEQKLF